MDTKDKSLSEPAAEPAADTFLTKEQAARLLGITVGTLQNYQKMQRLLPAPFASVPADVRAKADLEAGKRIRSFYPVADVTRLKDEVAAFKAERAENQKIVDGKKRCSKCKEVKPVSRFSPTWQNDNRLQSICLDCMSDQSADWTKRNPEQRRKSKRAWSKANPRDKAAAAASGKAYYAANKEQILAKQKAKRAKAKEPTDA